MADLTSTPASPRRLGLFKRVARMLRRLDAEDAVGEVAEVLRAREKSGEALAGASREMLLNAARFDQLPVADVMKPRADIVAVEASATLAEVVKVFTDSQHARLPIFRDTLDDPTGFVHVKDVLALLAPGSETKPTDRVLPRVRREILFVPPSMRLPTLLLKMRTTRIHLALVVDEYGGTDGLVSIEDLVEQIVGDIEDEHDEAPPPIIRRGKTVWEVDALAQISDVERETRLRIGVQEHEADIETVGGLATALAGRVPEAGQFVEHPAGHRFEILEADERRVVRLRIKAAAAGKATPSTDRSAAPMLADGVGPAQTAASPAVGAAGETS
jgi:CBS domain containing-hemolysin-like protein